MILHWRGNEAHTAEIKTAEFLSGYSRRQPKNVYKIDCITSMPAHEAAGSIETKCYRSNMLLICATIYIDKIYFGY